MATDARRGRTRARGVSDGLTPKQSRIRAAALELSREAGLNVQDYGDLSGQQLTTFLEVALRELVRAHVTTAFAWSDEALGTIVAQYFFGKRSPIALWKTARYRRFNHYILENLGFRAKLNLVRDLGKLRTTTFRQLDHLNTVRNGLAHTFFPENLRSARPMWRNASLFTVEGMRAFTADMAIVRADLYRHYP